MSQESTAQLVNFVREAFGARCADLLLVGLGGEPVEGAKKFDVSETEEGKEWEVEVEVVGGTLPSRSEPLVLAVLLKMLIGHDPIPSPLEIQMGKVVDELQRVGVTLTEGDVDRIISTYAALSYDKRLAGDDESEGGGGGMYSLVAGYFRDCGKEAAGMGSVPASGSVLFDQAFIAGLRRGEVVIAGIRFGRLMSPPR